MCGQKSMRTQPCGPDPDGEETEVRQAEHGADLEHQPASRLAPSGLILRPFSRTIRVGSPDSRIVARNLRCDPTAVLADDWEADSRWYRRPSDVILPWYCTLICRCGAHNGDSGRCRW